MTISPYADYSGCYLSFFRFGVGGLRCCQARLAAVDGHSWAQRLCAVFRLARHAVSLWRQHAHGAVARWLGGFALHPQRHGDGAVGYVGASTPEQLERIRFWHHGRGFPQHRLYGFAFVAEPVWPCSGGACHRHHRGRFVFHQLRLHCLIALRPSANPRRSHRLGSGHQKRVQHSPDMGDWFGRLGIDQCLGFARDADANRGLDGRCCSTRGLVHHWGLAGATCAVCGEWMVALAARGR